MKYELSLSSEAIRVGIQQAMFVNKWTVQMNYPGQIEEKGFDSQEELAAYVRGIEAQSVGGLPPVINVFDPKGEQTSIVLPVDGQNSPAGITT